MATRSGKFNFCHFEDGLMWCQFLNGTWAKPFKPTISVRKAKDSPKKLGESDAKV